MGKVEAISRRTVGLILIFFTAIIWIVTSFISESLVKATGTGGAPKIPAFLLTWLATTLFTLYLPFIYIQHWVVICWNRRKGSAFRSYDAVSTSESGVSSHGNTAARSAATNASTMLSHEEDKQTLSAALWSTPLWFLAQYTFNASLALTSVTSNTILSSTSSLCTFALSVILLGEKFTVRKLACILACMLGTALVTLSDVEASERLRSPPPALPPPLLAPSVDHNMRNLNAWPMQQFIIDSANPTSTTDSRFTWQVQLQMLIGSYTPAFPGQRQPHQLQHAGQLMRSVSSSPSDLLSIHQQEEEPCDDRRLREHSRRRGRDKRGMAGISWLPSWLRLSHMKGGGSIKGKIGIDEHKWSLDPKYMMSMWQRQHLARADQAAESTKRLVNLVQGQYHVVIGKGRGVGDQAWNTAGLQGSEDPSHDDYDAPVVKPVSDEDDIAVDDDEGLAGGADDTLNIQHFGGDSASDQGLGDDATANEGDNVIPEAPGTLQVLSQLRQLSGLIRHLLRSTDIEDQQEDPKSLLSTGEGDFSPPPPSGGTPFSKSPLLGDLLVLVSAFFYAGYTVVLRLKMPGEEAGHQVAQFFGYVGLLTTVGGAPLVILLLSVKVLDVSAIPRDVYWIILLEGMLDYVLSDYLWARAVMLLGPTIATLSLSVQIPLAIMIELFSGKPPPWTEQGSTILMTLIGTLFILAGFVGINLEGMGEGAGRELLDGAQDGGQPEVGKGFIWRLKSSQFVGSVRMVLVSAVSMLGMRLDKDKESEDEEGSGLLKTDGSRSRGQVQNTLQQP